MEGGGGGGGAVDGGGPLGGEAGAGKGERDTEVAKKVGIHWIGEINEIRNIVKQKWAESAEKEANISLKV